MLFYVHKKPIKMNFLRAITLRVFLWAESFLVHQTMNFISLYLFFTHPFAQMLSIVHHAFSDGLFSYKSMKTNHWSFNSLLQCNFKNQK